LRYLSLPSFSFSLTILASGGRLLNSLHATISPVYIATKLRTSVIYFISGIFVCLYSLSNCGACWIRVFDILGNLFLIPFSTLRIWLWIGGLVFSFSRYQTFSCLFPSVVTGVIPFLCNIFFFSSVFI